eukprot:CAMPEP_0181325578 /NCGR_PEP_ID=MMETSP1101-20121128/21009_1 /TAXON_ID=46948 /ORGANISM="Rhodomonas abbreviata, Strain Caron Lab Isolate" /LENGTH=388 /DNA_ID=CAMNT_0023433913 /DNA_START=192 /DNA_END=1355 /DNA_ORIENTATION=-
MNSSREQQSFMHPDRPKQLGFETTSQSAYGRARPFSAPGKQGAAAHASMVLGSMLDVKPETSNVPGYTGHQPGVVSESLLGRSYAYLTGYRKDLLFKGDDGWISEYNRSVCKGGPKFEPLLVKKPISAAQVSRPQPRTGQKQTGWTSSSKFYDVLNLNENSRMPGYTGHVPHFKFQGSVGLPFAKACSTGDHLRPPDGSHNKYMHQNPQHVGRERENKIAEQPIAGYGGFIPFMHESSCGQCYRDALKVCHETQAMDPKELRKVVDNVHAGYTPSMRRSLHGAKPHREDYVAGQETSSGNGKQAVENPIPRFVSGYAGFQPGVRIAKHSPEQYRAPQNADHNNTPRGSQIYLGDLTQEWNLGTPYRCTNGDYGQWTPQADPQKREKLW